MKKYIKSAIILLAALAFAGCSKAEEFQYNPDSALQIESVSGISPFALMQEPASKAVITGETLPGDEATKGIGLFVTAQGGGAYDGRTSGYSNVKYTFNNAKWSAASPIYLSNTTGKLYGYFPYNVDAANLTAIPVVSSLNGTDYLYATSQDVSFSNKSVNLQMNHALARLHLTIKKGDKYLSDCNLSKIVLKSKAIDASGTMNITTGAVTAAKVADEIGTFTLTGTDAVTKTGIEKDILFVPADNSEGKKDITLTLTIDGVDAEVKFTADKGLDIRSGIQNNVTLTIEDTGIKVTGVDVGVWGDRGSQTVQVSGHTVTVKISEDVTPHDILTDIYTDGGNVKIEAFSKSGKSIICKLSGTAEVSMIKSGNVYISTISDISSDVTATVDYFAGALVGKFSVSATKKVHFSKGNLYYDGSKFNFETNQYEVQTSWSTNHISHFYWSKDASVACAASYEESGTTGSDVFFTNETETTAKAGFTVNVEGKERSGWRTLSKEEWQYLFITRSNASSLYKYGVTVCGKVNCVVLLPDNWDGTVISLTNFANQNTFDESSTPKWSEMEDAGAVCLPAAGYRYGSDVDKGGVYGNYWSSTLDNNYNYVRYVFFSSSYFTPDSNELRTTGHNVRLVTEVK